MQRSILQDPEYRLEGREKVTGSARYTADLRPEWLLHVAFLRSPHAHASIRSIDGSRARAMPGVQAVLTGEDVRPARLGRQLLDWPVLAWDRVRLVGDRVAAVAAETLQQAEAALWEIDVDYEELPAVFDLDAALAPEAPVLHPDAASYRSLDDIQRHQPHPNVQGHQRHEHGDVDGGFAAASHVFEHEFELARTFTGYLEPRASLAWMQDGRYHVVSTNKAPFKLRAQLALGLDLPAEDLVVETGYIGGDFGGKGLSLDEYALTFLARATGRPVLSVTPYEDELAATNTRHGGRIRLRTAVDDEGRILAHEGHVVFDGGAYAAGKPHASLLPPKATYTLAGYAVPAARVEAMTVYTNTVPGGHARTPAQPQNAFAAEGHLDLIAEALGIDPFELRLRNALRPGDIDVANTRWERSLMVPVLEALDRERPPRPDGPGRGRGVAMSVRPAAAGKATVRVEVTADAHVRIVTGAPDQGGGAYTMIQRIVAETLSLPLEQVEVTHGSTDETPFDPGVGGSRVTPIVGGAAHAGAVALAGRLAELAPDQPIQDQLAQVARDGGLSISAEFDHPTGLLGANAYAVEVEVDLETGQIHVTDCLTVCDVGTIINPVAARGQLVGGYVSGFGQALMEEVRVEEGTVTTANLGDYKLPTMPDVPPLRLVLLDDDQGDGPFGAKGVGELTNSAIAPAIANAVADAIGARVHSLPLTPEKVLAAIDAAARDT